MKKMMIVLSIIIILIVSVLFILNSKSEDFKQEVGNTEIVKEEIEETKEGLQILDNRNKSYTLYRILKNYNLYLDYLDFDINTFEGFIAEDISEKELKEEYKKQGINALKEILDNEFQEKYYKNENDMYSKLKEYANTDLNIEEIYILEEGGNIEKYIIKLLSEEYIAIKMDKEDNTFSIYGNELFEDIDDLTLLDINSDNIEMKNYNRYSNEKIDEQGIINEYFRIYNDAVSKNIEDSYLLIDEEYKKNKFTDIEDYKKYVENNYEEANLEKYQIYKDGYKNHYICVDSNSKYYIFIEKRPFSFSTVLDTYTINLPEFTQKYNNVDDKTKVAYNIEKLISAINDKDYKYVYEKMDKTFRETKFPTLESFEQTVEYMFFEKNKVQYEEYDKKGDTHIYTIVLNDYYEELDYQDKKQIFMKLKDNYDFVFSFTTE